MDFSPNISLTHKANIVVISSLWNQNGIITDIQKILFGDAFQKDWSDIESDVLSLLKKLELPYALKLSLQNIVQPMGREIQKWIQLTLPAFRNYPHLEKPIMFVWTEKGLLDYCKTAELIIKYNSDKELCFCLACIFCIEDIILKLWPDVRHTLSKKVSASSVVENKFLTYWVHNLNDDLLNLIAFTEYRGLMNTYVFAFLLILETKCVDSLNYFLQKINPEMKETVVKRTTLDILKGRHLCDGNLLLFLFNHLTESDINQIKQLYCYRILSLLLEWPYQEIFMANVISSWKYLSNMDYLNLFQDILEYVARYYESNLYKNLIKQFWKSSPVSFKEYTISKCISGTFLSRIFQYENTDEIAQMIFRDCNPNEKQMIIFHYEGMNVCDLLVKKERWQSLKFLIKECIPSSDVLEEFIEQYKNYKPYYYQERTELRTAVLIEKVREWY